VIALDTNVLVRYVFDSGDPHHAPASAIIDERCSPSSPGFVSHVTLAEFAWVARRTFKVTRGELGAALASILDHENLAVEDAQLVEAALGDFQVGRADFTDYLAAAIGRRHDASPFVTFDQIAAREPGYQSAL